MSVYMVAASSQFATVADYAAMPDTQPLTVAAWVKLSTQARMVWFGRNGGGSGWGAGISSAGAPQFTAFGVKDYIFNVAGALSVGRWYHLAFVYNSDFSVDCHVDGTLRESQTHTAGASNPGTIGAAIGREGPSTAFAYMDGCLAVPTVWNVALSPRAIDELGRGARPQTIRPDANAGGPWFDNGRWGWDESGRGGYAPATGGPRLADDPPQLRSRIRRWPAVKKHAAGGTTYTITPSGAVVPAGAVSKQTSKPLSGSFTPAGTLAKATQKPLAGGITPSGALALVKVVLRSFAGGITPTGALAKTANKALTGSSTPAGALTRSTTKALAGAVAPAGALLKLVTKPLAGTATPSGSLGLVRVILRSFAGAITPTGSLRRQANKQLTGTVTPAGSLRRDITKTLTAAIAPTGTLRKLLVRRFTGAITPAGSVARQIGAAVWSLLRLRSWDHRSVATRMREHRAVRTELHDHPADDIDSSEH